MEGGRLLTGRPFPPACLPLRTAHGACYEPMSQSGQQQHQQHQQQTPMSSREAMQATQRYHASIHAGRPASQPASVTGNRPKNTDRPAGRPSGSYHAQMSRTRTCTAYKTFCCTKPQFHGRSFLVESSWTRRTRPVSSYKMLASSS